LRGGVAPARACIPELLDDVPGRPHRSRRVFDFAIVLDAIVEAYAAMDERRAVESLMRVGRV